jgi:8-oxo-dGTP pyrophosphatase MutT (NUDIX family)
MAQRLHEELGAWHPRSPDQLTLRAEYEQFLTDGRATAIERVLGRAHVTGSAFVFTPDLRNILLGLHKKAGFWIQLGGHVETMDDSVRATARREAQEEGGIADLTDIGNGPLDLDRHELGPGFIRCDTHWDIGYGFLATGTPITSDESEAVEWWPVDHLPDNVPSNFAVRVRRAADFARH